MTTMREMIDKESARIALLNRLIVEFPDLAEYRGRWETVLTSKLVNACPDKVYLKHSCGCCADAALQAWFHVERDGERVYTNPPYVCVGEKDMWGPHDDVWLDDWEDRVRKAIGEAAVRLAKERLHPVYRSPGEGFVDDATP